MALGQQDKKNVQMRDARAGGMSRPRPGMADHLAGEAGDFVRDLKPYLPQELVGGTVPHIPGTEDEAVWNAASQACGTEKIHYCYSVDEGRLWYLACPSNVLASNPDSWCPLAAALPGNSEYWDQETVYLYEQEGVASALRWDPETHRMQVFLGASRTILPRVQSMEANFVSVNAEVADIVPWRNRTLRTEKLARATAKMLVLTGMLVAFCAVVLLLFNYISLNLLQRNLDDVKTQSEEASLELVRSANSVMKSDTIKHMVRIQELLDGLAKVDGTLVLYNIEKGRLKWEALVPQAFAVQAMQELNAQPHSNPKGKDGRMRIKGSR